MTLRSYIKCTTTTSSGTATLQGLTRVTNFPAPTHGLRDGERVTYSILTADGYPIATEEGTYNTSSDTITRDYAVETWDETTTTFNYLSPSKITLVNSTEYIIVITPNAFGIAQSMCGVDDNSSGVARYTHSDHCEWAGQFQTWTADRVYYGTLNLRHRKEFDSLMVKLSTTAGGAKCRLGLYEALKGGYIGDKIEETAELDAGTAYLTVDGAINTQKLPPGDYYIACVGDSSSIRTMSFPYNRSRPTTMGFTTDIYPISYRYETTTGNALPDTANTTTSAVNVGSGYMPIVFMGLV